MLKSTKMKLRQQAAAISVQMETNNIKRESNTLKKEELEELKRHNLVDEETKDRVDISKKEYLALLKDVKDYKESAEQKKETLWKIFNPLIKNKVSASLFNALINGDFKCDIFLEKEPASCKTKIIMSYEINDIDIQKYE